MDLLPDIHLIATEDHSVYFGTVSMEPSFPSTPTRIHKDLVAESPIKAREDFILSTQAQFFRGGLSERETFKELQSDWKSYGLRLGRVW